MKYANIQTIAPTNINPSFNGPAIDLSNVLYLSAQVVTTAGTSPTYAAKIQVSNDPSPQGGLPNTFTPTNWNDLSGATVSVTANGAMLIPKQDMSYRWARVVITYASGTGTTAVNVFGVCI